MLEVFRVWLAMSGQKGYGKVLWKAVTPVLNLTLRALSYMQ